MQIKTPLDLYKILDKSNCQRCMLPSCMAFAVAVIQGTRQLSDCPQLDPAIITGLRSGIAPKTFLADDQEAIVRELQAKVAELDFDQVARRIDAVVIDGRLAVHCLGKDFLIDSEGRLTSACHLIPWVLLPLLNYILHCEGKEPRGDWVAMAELHDSAQWGHYFSHRCEEPLRQLTDAHPDLVFEILQVFQAVLTDADSSADFSVVIHPLPLVPVLINYWQAEEEFTSKLNILFDRSAEKNIPAEALYMLVRGIVEMFRQLIVRHSKEGKIF
jgi:hypothetical protein